MFWRPFSLVRRMRDGDSTGQASIVRRVLGVGGYVSVKVVMLTWTSDRSVGFR